jgi:hypothetical protein
MRRDRPRSRAAEERDEVAPSHAKLPVEDKAYQRAALCVTAKIGPLMTLWIIHVDRHTPAACEHVRFALIASDAGHPM